MVLKTKSFVEAKVGDKVTRMVAGTLAVPMTVVEIKGDLLVCSADDSPQGIFWEFDINTGMEVDESLEWGPKFRATGSILVPTAPKSTTN